MRSHEAGHQEKRFRTVTAAQKIPALAGNPVGGMVLFLVNPRTNHPTVAVQASIYGVCIHTKLLLEPPIIIIGHTLVFITGRSGAAVGMKIAVMQPYIVESQIIAQRVNVHFTDALRIVARLTQLPSQRVGVVPRH